MRACSQMEEGVNAFKILTDKTTGQRPPGRPRGLLEGNIIIDLEKIGVKIRNWSDSAQEGDNQKTLVNAAFNFRIL